MADSALSKFVIHHCHPEEAAAVLALWQQAEATASVTDTIEDLQHAITESSTVVLVAKAENRIIGSVIGSFDGWRGNVYRLSVHPAYRLQGIARALVAEVERHLIRQGAKRITALVEKDHPWAMGFWRAIGYEVDSRMVRFVRDL